MSTNKLPWFKFFASDFRDKTDHLSNAEIGAYIRLLVSYWASTGLPNDERKLKRIAQIHSPEDGDLNTILGEFFDVDDNDAIRHRELDALLAEAIGEQDAQTRRTENARKARAAARVSVADNVTTSVTETDVRRETQTEDGRPETVDPHSRLETPDLQTEDGRPQTPKEERDDPQAKLRELEQLWANTPQDTPENRTLRAQRRKAYLDYKRTLDSTPEAMAA